MPWVYILSFQLFTSHSRIVFSVSALSLQHVPKLKKSNIFSTFGRCPFSSSSSADRPMTPWRCNNEDALFIEAQTNKRERGKGKERGHDVVSRMFFLFLWGNVIKVVVPVFSKDKFGKNINFKMLNINFTNAF